MNPKCPACQQHYPPNGGGHCRGCCHTFSSQTSFDAHRQGPYNDRSCHPVEGDTEWRNTPRGWTNAEPFAAFSVTE